MSRKVIFILATVVVFFALDLNWLYPLVFNNLPQISRWVIAFTLAGFEAAALLAEWYRLDWQPW
jgi:hypothetical protein